MTHQLTICTLTTLLMISCVQSETLDKRMLGTWTMEKVYEYENDVTETHNPKKERWIEFKSDASFVSDGEPFGRNTGRWMAENRRSLLYIDSDIDDDDSEWKVTFDKDQMTWIGIGHPRKENTKLIHRRKL